MESPLKHGKKVNFESAGSWVLAKIDSGSMNTIVSGAAQKKHFDDQTQIKKYIVHNPVEKPTPSKIEPSYLDKAGKPTKLIYIDNSSRPLPNIIPYSVAEILRNNVKNNFIT